MPPALVPELSLLILLKIRLLCPTLDMSTNTCVLDLQIPRVCLTYQILAGSCLQLCCPNCLYLFYSRFASFVLLWCEYKHLSLGPPSSKTSVTRFLQIHASSFATRIASTSFTPDSLPLSHSGCRYRHLDLQGPSCGWTLPRTNGRGDFLDIIDRNPSVSKSSGFPVDIFRFFFTT